MKCALCIDNEANKTNTHYLSDAIIRSCLNLDGLDGNKNREKGFYFDISNSSAFVEFNFQRATSIPRLEEALGRKPTDEEINQAMQIPFSVDYVFCKNCEDKFTAIENDFLNHILPRLRGQNLDGVLEISFTEIKTIRLFCYIQIWRTAICEEIFSIDTETLNQLRNFIFNHDQIELDELNIFPISITYLQTKGEQKEYTSNYVGFTSDINPNIIFMNDFVLQFYDSINSVRFLEFYGLNEGENFDHFINYKETETIKLKIVQHEKRKELLNRIINTEKVKQTIKFYEDSFKKLWFYIFGVIPSLRIIDEYLKSIIKDDEFNVLKYSQSNIIELTQNFIESKIK